MLQILPTKPYKITTQKKNIILNATTSLLYNQEEVWIKRKITKIKTKFSTVQWKENIEQKCVS